MKKILTEHPSITKKSSMKLKKIMKIKNLQEWMKKTAFSKIKNQFSKNNLKSKKSDKRQRRKEKKHVMTLRTFLSTLEHSSLTIFLTKIKLLRMIHL